MGPLRGGPVDQTLRSWIGSRQNRTGLQGMATGPVEAEPTAEHDLSLAERRLHIAPLPHKAWTGVAGSGAVHRGGAWRQRRLGVGHGGQDVVIDPDLFAGIL